MKPPVTSLAGASAAPDVFTAEACCYAKERGTMWQRAIIFLILATTSTVAVAQRCLAAVGEFPIPVTTIGVGSHYCDIDLGTPAARVRSITFVAAGTCRAPSIASTADCSAPYSFPIEMFLSLEASGHTYYIEVYSWIPAGAFAFADTIVPPESWTQLFQTGQESLNLFCFSHYYTWGHEPHDPHFPVFDCSVGAFEFSAPPLLTVEFEPALASELTAWSSVKALYR